MRTLRIASSVFLLLSIGCAEPGAFDSLPDATPFGEHIAFWTDSLEPVCGGNLAYMDRYVGALKEIHASDPDYRIKYYFFTQSHTPCPKGACTTEDGIVATGFIPHHHELVHAVRSENNFSHRFFEEGAAELWGDNFDRRSSTPDVEEGIRATDREGETPFDFYPVAGLFSRYLQQEYGSDFVATLPRETAADSTYDDVDAVFQDVVGEPLGTVISRFDELGLACERTRYRDLSVACAAAPRLECTGSDADRGYADVVVDPSCSGDDALGPKNGITWTSFVVSTRGLPTFEYRDLSDAVGLSSEFGYVEYEPCVANGVCESGGSPLTEGVNTGEFYLLSEGDYLVTVARYVDSPDDAFREIRLMVDGISCDAGG